MLAPHQIAERLGDRFRLLGGAPSGIPSHRTLLASLDWSYDLLPERQQLALRRMSTFAGSCTFEAAEAVCGAGDRTVELLSDLVDASLVIADMTGDHARYRLRWDIGSGGPARSPASGAWPATAATGRWRAGSTPRARASGATWASLAGSASR